MRKTNATRNIIILIVIILLGISSAYFYAQGNSEIQSIATAKLELEYTTIETTFTEDINLYPIRLSNIKNKGAKISFTVTNTIEEDIYSTVSFGNVSIPEVLKNEYFGWSLYENESQITSGTFKFIGSETKFPILEQLIKGNVTKNYTVYVYLIDSLQSQNEMMNQYFNMKIVIDGRYIKETDSSCFTVSDGIITDYDDLCPKDVVIPSFIEEEEITTVGENAFKDKDLNSIIIPDSITTLGNYAFANNDLNRVTLPESVVSIGNFCFIRNKLTEVVFIGQVSIGSAAFSENLLTNVAIPNNTVSIEPDAFSNNFIPTVLIPNNVLTVKSHAFYNNPLTSVLVDNYDNILTIEENAFYNGDDDITPIYLR